jgi:hypothetical protein
LSTCEEGYLEGKLNKECIAKNNMKGNVVEEEFLGRVVGIKIGN